MTPRIDLEEKGRAALLDNAIRIEVGVLLLAKSDKEKFTDELFFLMRSRIAVIAMLRYYQDTNSEFKSLVEDILGQEPAGVRQFIEKYNLELEKEYGKAEGERVSFI